MSFNPEKMINKTVSSMPPSGIRRFFDVAAEMEDCISLGVGEPDFVTPWHIRDFILWKRGIRIILQIQD